MSETKRKNYDSDFCGNVPLNFINSIQPYGALLVLDKAKLNVIQASENVVVLFHRPVDEIVASPFSSLVAPEDWPSLSEKMNRSSFRQSIPLRFTFLGVSCLAIMHFQEAQILLEIEKKELGISDFSTIYQDVKYIIALLKEAENVEEVCHVAAKEIKKMSGFDKVMVYRFDEEWNGHVMSEEKEENMDSYFGLRFPASDIPKQARELYLKNPYRWIPNNRYEPVKLQPVLNPLSFKFTDLSPCNLRGVPAVHLEYLDNMKVGASMSTPIVKNGQLWGLITCHHKTPRALHYDMRCAFELLSDFISAQLASQERESLLRHGSQLQLVQNSLYKQMVTAESSVEGLFSPPDSLFQLLDITGAALFYQDKLIKIGQTPPETFVKELLFWLKINKIDQVYTTTSISESIDIKTPHNAIASGLLAIPISPKNEEYILGFRPEAVQTVQWGGNPNDAIQFESDKKNYHPRNSFAIWQETVRNTSQPWKPGTLKAAEDLQKSILEMVRARRTS